MIIGLGNYGETFNLTRHNVGFEVLDILNSKNEKWTAGGHGLWCLNWHLDAVMLKPTTGMNACGLMAQDALQTIQGDITHIIIIHDDMDFEPGQVRIKVGGGDGKHNGLKSVIGKIGPDFTRIRIGIGKPNTKEGIDFVLGKFSGKERKIMDEAVQLAAEAINWVIKDGVQQAMNRFNRKEKE
jgi:PTH1 family peptidyl-tRNA hydrolase